MKELKRFQGSTFDTIARRRLVEDQDTILEFTGKIQDLKNEINCLKKLIDIFNIQFQKKEARQKQTFCVTFKLENRKEKYLWSF